MALKKEKKEVPADPETEIQLRPLIFVDPFNVSFAKLAYLLTIMDRRNVNRTFGLRRYDPENLKPTKIMEKDPKIKEKYNKLQEIRESRKVVHTIYKMLLHIVFVILFTMMPSIPSIARAASGLLSRDSTTPSPSADIADSASALTSADSANVSAPVDIADSANVSAPVDIADSASALTPADIADSASALTSADFANPSSSADATALQIIPKDIVINADLEDKLQTMKFLLQQDETMLQKCFLDSIVSRLDITEDQKRSYLLRYETLGKVFDTDPNTWNELRKKCVDNDFDSLYDIVERIRKEYSSTELVAVSSFYAFGKTSIKGDKYTYLDFQNMENVQKVVDLFNKQEDSRFFRLAPIVMRKLNEKIMSEFLHDKCNIFGCDPGAIQLASDLSFRVINRAWFFISNTLEPHQWAEIGINEYTDGNMMIKLQNMLASNFSHLIVNTPGLAYHGYRMLYPLPPSAKPWPMQVRAFLSAVPSVITYVTADLFKERGVRWNDYLNTLEDKLKNEIKESLLWHYRSWLSNPVLNKVRKTFGLDNTSWYQYKERELVARIIAKTLLSDRDEEFEVFVKDEYKKYGEKKESLAQLFGRVLYPDHRDTMEITKRAITGTARGIQSSLSGTAAGQVQF